MGHIHCCGGLRKSRTFLLIPQDEYTYAQVDYLEFCPVCGHTVVQVTRMDKNYNVSTIRKINEKARVLFNKLKSKIRCEKNAEIKCNNKYSNFYLYYNEYGKRKKCYSNLSTLKLGLFESK